MQAGEHESEDEASTDDVLADFLSHTAEENDSNVPDEAACSVATFPPLRFGDDVEIDEDLVLLDGLSRLDAINTASEEDVRCGVPPCSVASVKSNLSSPVWRLMTYCY